MLAFNYNKLDKSSVYHLNGGFYSKFNIGQTGRSLKKMNINLVLIRKKIKLIMTTI